MMKSSRGWILCLALGLTAAQAADEGVVSKVGRGVEKGAQSVGKGVEKGVEVTGKEVNKGAEATGRFFQKADRWIDSKINKKGSGSGGEGK